MWPTHFKHQLAGNDLRKENMKIYFIPSSESSAYIKQIKGILFAVKKYRIFSLVTNTIFIFSL